MDNSEFRKLMLSKSTGDSDGSAPARPRALGAKKSSFAAMTPRHGNAPSSSDFARQVREQHASLRPSKKFKSSAPKGIKFATGYTDRASARRETEDDDEDDKAKRIKALEEQVKLGQLPQKTFEALRDQITGGDISSTHLVKGLDWRLLERVRRGEDVLGSKESRDEESLADVDEELDKLGEKEVHVVKKEQTEKKGLKSSRPIAGVKRTRDEIMAQLKAQRKAAAEARAAAAPTFDNRWRKVGEQVKSRIEIDHKGREVLITVDEDGHVKKKIRKAPAQPSDETSARMKPPDASRPVLGADVAVPEHPKPDEVDVDQDDDIFEGAGTEYNPLGDIGSEDDSDSDSDSGNGIMHQASGKQTIGESVKPAESMNTTTEAPEATKPSTAPKSYFKDSVITKPEQTQDHFKGIENVLKKAAKLDSEGSPTLDDEESGHKQEKEARLAKRAKMLAQHDRDLEDMELGFGSSRMEDEEEGGGGESIRLSEWKSKTGADNEAWEKDERGAGKQKRKSKKRKGDVNSAADIMRVIEGRKSGASK